MPTFDFNLTGTHQYSRLEEFADDCPDGATLNVCLGNTSSRQIEQLQNLLSKEGFLDRRTQWYISLQDPTCYPLIGNRLLDDDKASVWGLVTSPNSGQLTELHFSGTNLLWYNTESTNGMDEIGFMFFSQDDQWVDQNSWTDFMLYGLHPSTHPDTKSKIDTWHENLENSGNEITTPDSASNARFFLAETGALSGAESHQLPIPRTKMSFFTRKDEEYQKGDKTKVQFDVSNSSYPNRSVSIAEGSNMCRIDLPADEIRNVDLLQYSVLFWYRGESDESEHRFSVYRSSVLV